MLFTKTNLVVLVALFVSAATVGCSGTGKMDPASVHRIVVMPFEDATAQKDFGNLADGIAQRVTTSLGTAKGIDVIASFSGMEYKVRPRATKDVQQTLNVDALVEGDVNIAGGTMTVNAWVRDARSDKRVWETKATGKREAGFVLADDVAEALSKWLAKPLRMKKSVAAPDWKNFLFLMEGARLIHLVQTKDVNLAVYDLETLRGAHAEFWPAHIPTAELFGRLVEEEFLTGDRAREWVKGILYDVRQVEPESAEAYFAEGILKYYVDWDFAAAEPLLKKAIEARPNLMYAWLGLTQLYVTTNRLPLAIETIEKARLLDPLGYDTVHEYSLMLAAAGRFDDALAQLEIAAGLTKMETVITAQRGLLQFAKGDAEAARISLTALLEDNKDEPVALQSLFGAVMAKLGKPAETRRMLDLVSSRPKRELAAADPIHFALLHMSAGDVAKGFSELGTAIALRRTLALRLPGLPQFAQYHNDPRWQPLMAKLAASKPIAAPQQAK